MPPLHIFDLDGTLIDSHQDIHRCVWLAVEECGRPGVSFEEVASYWGAPLHVYHESLKVPSTVDEFVASYRAHYDRVGLATTQPFDGIEEMLASLDGVDLAVASTKPTFRVKAHCQAFGLDRYFIHLEGCDEPPYKPDPAVLERVLDATGHSAAESTMIGDLPSDILAGKALGMRTVGVTYGGTATERLTEVGADVVVSAVTELARVLQATRSRRSSEEGKKVGKQE